MKKSDKKKLKKYIDKALEKDREQMVYSIIEYFAAQQIEVCKEPIVCEKPVTIGTSPKSGQPVRREKKFEIDDEMQKVLDQF